MEFDLTERITEQLSPTAATLKRRIRAELTDRDRAAIALALVEAATTGARVAYASMAANAAEAGVELPGRSTNA